jgi:hypothetical protein
VNQYVYAANNPYQSVDPSGLYSKCTLGAKYSIDCDPNPNPMKGNGGGYIDPGAMGKLFGLGLAWIFNQCQQIIFPPESSRKPKSPPHSPKPTPRRPQSEENPRQHALDACIEAAKGTETDWEIFCLSSRYFFRLDRSRSQRCRRYSLSSQTEKINFCYNEFGD